MSADFAAAGETALRNGAPILCDSKMVEHGVTRARLQPPTRSSAPSATRAFRVWRGRIGNTRSAAALELWRERLGDAVVVIGNAPTALFRLLEILDEGVPPPAAVIGVPVGFVGAAEAKRALAQDRRVPFLVVHGRRGGSAIAAAAINALASAAE